jgi:type II secretory pathway component PulF
LTSIIEPVLILGMGLVIGVVVISMLLAIFSINDLPF